MDNVIALLTEHWWMAVCLAVALFSIVAQITPNKVDNRILFYLLKVVDFIALNFRKPTILTKSEDGTVAVDFDKYKSGFIRPPLIAGFVLLALLVMACTGCVKNVAPALENLSPVDKAIVVTDEVTNAYEAVRAEYVDLVGTLGHDKAEWIKTNVAPALDEGRDALVMVRESVAIWKATQVKPDEYDGQLVRVRALIADAWAKIAQLTGKEE